MNEDVTKLYGGSLRGKIVRSHHWGSHSSGEWPKPHPVSKQCLSICFSFSHLTLYSCTSCTPRSSFALHVPYLHLKFTFSFSQFMLQSRTSRSMSSSLPLHLYSQWSSHHHYDFMLQSCIARTSVALCSSVFPFCASSLQFAHLWNFALNCEKFERFKWKHAWVSQEYWKKEDKIFNRS